MTVVAADAAGPVGLGAAAVSTSMLSTCSVKDRFVDSKSRRKSSRVFALIPFAPRPLPDMAAREWDCGRR
eukprot:283456-Alexandrium_andersonii.AAC.1